MNLEELDKIWSQCVDAVCRDLALERWQVEEALAYGGCAALALSLNQSLDLPIYIAASENSYLHAFCAASDDKGLDIWGVRPFRTIKAVWSEDDPSVELLEISAPDLWAMGGLHLCDEFKTVPSKLADRLIEALQALPEP
jgi:hypothetical protein